MVLEITVRADGMNASTGFWLCSHGSCVWVNGLIACTQAMVLGWYVACSMGGICWYFLCPRCGLAYILVGLTDWPVCEVWFGLPGCGFGFIWYVCQLAFVCLYRADVLSYIYRGGAVRFCIFLVVVWLCLFGFWLSSPLPGVWA